MKNKIIGILVTSGLTATVVLITVAVCFHLNGGSPGAVPVNQAAVTTANSADNVGTSETIAIPGFKQMTMKAGQIVQTVKLSNPEQNACYMVVTIMLPDKTQLYKSGMLAPGKVLDTIELSRKPEAGTYKDAILQYSCYALDSLQELNGAETIFTLEVEQ